MQGGPPPMGGGFALLRWVGAWGGPHPLQKRDFPPFAVGGMRETKINPSSRIPLTADEGKISLLRWVAAASCLPHPLHIIWQIVMKIPASDSGGWGGVGWVLLHTTPPHPLHTVMYTIKYSMPAPTHGKRGNPPTMVGGPPCMVCRVQFPHS